MTIPILVVFLLLSQGVDAVLGPFKLLRPPCRGGGKLALVNSKEEVYIMDSFDDNDKVDDSGEAAEVLLDALEDEIHQVVSSYRSEVSETIDKLRLEMKYKANGEAYNRTLLDIPSLEESKSILEDTATNLSTELKSLLESSRWNSPYNRLASSMRSKAGGSAIMLRWNNLQALVMGNYVYYSMFAFATSYLLTRVVTRAVRCYTAYRAVAIPPPPPAVQALQWIRKELAVLKMLLLKVFVCMLSGWRKCS